MNTSSDFLAGWQSEKDFAKSVNKSPRTTRRWRQQPNGLPFAVLGKEVLINVEEARRWLFDRLQRPAPRRAPERRRAA